MQLVEARHGLVAKRLDPVDETGLERQRMDPTKDGAKNIFAGNRVFQIKIAE
jgi:hypothetical protein